MFLSYDVFVFNERNEVACFQRVIDNIIKQKIYLYIIYFAYLDDVTIYQCSKSERTWRQSGKIYESCVEKYGLTINKSNYQFSKSSIGLLPYLIVKNTLKHDSESIKSLLTLSDPANSVTKASTWNVCQLLEMDAQFFRENKISLYKQLSFVKWCCK